MRERIKQFGVGALGFALLLALYLAYGWTSARYREFVVMRLVVVSLACQQPTEATKIGIVCPAAAEPPAPTPAAKPGG